MSLKKFFSFSVPLIIMLFTFTIYITISKILVNYEKSINNDYSIVVVTTTPLNTNKVKEIDSIDLKKIVHLQREKILKNLKDDLSDGSYTLLEKKLPYFYTIQLNHFPTSSKLKKIKSDLLSLGGIKSVDTFSKDHDKIYSLLILTKTIISVLFIFIVIFTFLIMINQIKIWFYEHKQRLDIIKLHGGSIYYGAKPIITVALVSSLFSTVLVIGSIYLIKQNLSAIFTPEILDIIINNLSAYSLAEIFSVVVLSFVLSMVTVFGILVKYRIK